VSFTILTLFTITLLIAHGQCNRKFNTQLQALASSDDGEKSIFLMILRILPVFTSFFDYFAEHFSRGKKVGKEINQIE